MQWILDLDFVLWPEVRHKKGYFFVSDAIAQLAVDNTRNILYTRSEKGTIQVLRTLEMI